MTIFDYLSASALSLVISGNTGISPFLSLWIVGLCERVDPTLLNMTGNMEALLSSWPALIFLGVMTILEFLAKCIPVLDEVVDSIMVFLVPVVSAIGSLSTFGVFDSTYNFSVDDIDMNNVQVNYNDDAAAAADGAEADGAARFLEDMGANSHSSALMVLQGFLIVVGIGLALLIHMFKMIVRLLGEGCLTNFITIVETTWIAISITIAIYIRPIAIGVAILLGCAGAFSFKRNFYDKRFKRQENQNDDNNTRELPLAGDTDYNEKEATNEATTLASTDQSRTTTSYVVMAERD